MQKTEKKYNTVKVEDTRGRILMHDITRVVPGKFKGPAFKKGHVIKEEDIPLLKDLGKERVYAFEIEKGFCHEDEAALLFKKLSGSGLRCEGPSEGKIVFVSEVEGMSLINKNAVDKINALGDIALTTIHSGIPVKKGDKIGGIRALPLVIDEEKVKKALAVSSSAAVDVIPFKKKKVGLIVTGEEVASGRIKDGFKPVIEEKLDSYKSSIVYFSTPGDDPDKISAAVEEALQQGCDFIIVTGGMSVDPDDLTTAGIEKAGVEIVSRGAPVLPGNMLLVGYREDVAVLGVPACALHAEITALDLFLPFVFAGKKIKKEDVLEKGYGGFCRSCRVCIFPRCALGK